MKCKELQIEDKVALINGIIATIVEVGEDYAYAVLNGYETMDPWEFNDQDNHPEGIPITPEILEKNGWWYDMDTWNHEEVNFCIEKWDGRFQCYDINQIKLDSVHKLQHVLRLCGLNELADNFKV